MWDQSSLVARARWLAAGTWRRDRRVTLKRAQLDAHVKAVILTQVLAIPDASALRRSQLAHSSPGWAAQVATCCRPAVPSPASVSCCSMS